MSRKANQTGRGQNSQRTVKNLFTDSSCGLMRLSLKYLAIMRKKREANSLRTAAWWWQHHDAGKTVHLTEQEQYVETLKEDIRFSLISCQRGNLCMSSDCRDLKLRSV